MRVPFLLLVGLSFFAAPVKAVSIRLLDSTIGSGPTEVLSDFYLGQGYDSQTFSGSVSSEIVTGADLLVIGLPDADFTAVEVEVMATYLSEGGRIFFFGDHLSYTSQNARMNLAIADLGSTLRITGSPADNGLHDTNPDQIMAHALTDGVNVFNYGATSYVEGAAAGNWLINIANGKRPFIAIDPTIGNGIVVSGDSNWADGLGNPMNDNGQFFVNLATVSTIAPIPSPSGELPAVSVPDGGMTIVILIIGLTAVVLWERVERAIERRRPANEAPSFSRCRCDRVAGNGGLKDGHPSVRRGRDSKSCADARTVNVQRYAE